MGSLIDITMVRPRLRSDVLFIPAESGACLVDGERVVTVASPWAYPMLEKLSPHLTGDRTVAELTEDLPDSERQMVERLVTVLRDENLIRDASQDEPHGLSPAELRAFAAEISVIGSFLDSAPRRFQTWRESRLLLVGSGPGLVALVAAALRSGPLRVRAQVMPEAGTDLQRVEDHRRMAAQRDPGQRLTVCSPTGDGGPPTLADLEAHARDSDVVLHISDAPSPERAAELDEICRRSGIFLVQAVTSGDEAWIGPVSRPDRPDTGWRAAWLRIRSNDPVPAFGFGPTGPAESSDLLTGPAAAITAHHLVFAAFTHVTGIVRAEEKPAVTHLDLRTLAGESRGVAPHPAALPVRPSSAGDVVALTERLARADRVTEDAFFQRVTQLTDERTGLFTWFDDAGLPQAPLRLTRLSVVNADGFPHRHRAVVSGAALDLADARRRAARQAIAVYASLARDPRRHAAETAGPDAASVYGVCLRSGQAVPVAERLAFPAWYAVRYGRPYAVPAGLAVAPSWNDAVDAGLLAHCRVLAVARAGREPAPRLDLAAVDLDGEGRRCRDLLADTGRTVDVRDITAFAGVPTYTFALDGETVCHRAALSTAEAVRDGLLRTLRALQVNLAPPWEPGLPEPDGAGAVPPAIPVPAPPPDVRRRVLTDALASAGRRAVAVPLDTDPALGGTLPFPVQVVLIDA
jgi:hypothetical protein